MTREIGEDGQTCERCGDLAPWDSVVCVECGWRLGLPSPQVAVEDGDE